MNETIEHPDDLSSGRSGPRWIRRGVILAVLAPLGVLAVVMAVRVGPHLVGGGDNATNELHLRDIGSYPVLLGPYSRDGWSHPGPALFYLLVAGYRLAGSTSVGMYLSAVVINGAAVTTILTLSRRFGGTALLLLNGLAMAVLIHHLGPGFMSDPWNPYLTVLPFGALVVCCWAATCGGRWMAPAVVFLASFCVQTHIGYLPLVAFVVAWAAVVAFLRGRREHRRLPAAELIAAGLVGAVMWLPPLLQQLTARRGNLSALVSYFRHPSQPVNSVSRGYAIVAHSLGPNPEWLHPLATNHLVRLVPKASLTAVPIWFLLFAVAGIPILRRGPMPARALTGVIGICTLAGVVSIWRTPGPIIDYRLRWLPMLSLLTAAAAIWFLWLALQRASGVLRGRVRVLGRVAGGLTLAAIGVVSVMSIADAGAFGADDVGANGALAATLLSDGRTALPARRGQIIVRAVGPFEAFVVPGAVLWLEERGYDARVPVIEGSRTVPFDSGLTYGDHRLCDASPIAGEVLFVLHLGRPTPIGGGYRRIATIALPGNGHQARPHEALYLREGGRPDPSIRCRATSP